MNQPQPSESEWLAQIGMARRQGDNLLAYDLSVQARAAWPDRIDFEYQAILALTRAGALGGARARYDALVASGRLEAIADPALAEDVAALDGRLCKGLAARSADPQALRARSALAYAAAYDRFGGFFTAINAAAMFLAAGRSDQARSYAALAQAQAGVAPADYWSIVTQAEAALILGDPAATGRLLQSASDFGTGSLDELATSRRQLAWLAALLDAPPETLAALARPRVLNWLSGAAPKDWSGVDEATGESMMAFGPILGGSDVVMAETLLAAGAELHLVLPCEPQLMPAAMSGLRNPGPLEALLSRARSVMLVTKEGGPNEPAARLLCQQQARGLAILRAESLAVAVEQCTLEGQAIVIRPMPDDNADLRAPSASRMAPSELERHPRAILFGDVRGFSRLTEAEQLVFISHVIGAFAEILCRYPAKDYAETAGDGLYVVFADIVAAAECCFELQAALASDRIAAAGLPDHLGLRLSAHVGPVYRRYDPVIARDKFCGMEVIRTARIEPVTPVGEIFVTEQFAAALACAARDRFICEYAGLQPMAKGFGACRMYSLQRLIN